MQLRSSVSSVIIMVGDGASSSVAPLWLLEESSKDVPRTVCAQRLTYYGTTNMDILSCNVLDLSIHHRRRSCFRKYLCSRTDRRTCTSQGSSSCHLFIPNFMVSRIDHGGVDNVCNISNPMRLVLANTVTSSRASCRYTNGRCLVST